MRTSSLSRFPSTFITLAYGAIALSCVAWPVYAQQNALNAKKNILTAKPLPPIAALKPAITKMSPSVGTGATQVVLTTADKLLPFVANPITRKRSRSPVSVTFGNQRAGNAVVNDDGTITAGTPYNAVAGQSVKVTAIVNDKTYTSRGFFSYPVAEMDVTGPMAYSASTIGDPRWASGRNHLMVSKASGVITFSEPPVLHVMASFTDATSAVPASYNPPTAVGNYGVFTSRLQYCDVSHQPAAPTGGCKNWDGSTGVWQNFGRTVTVRLERDKPDVSVFGDIALPTKGLFDQANLVRTLRVDMHLEENDTHRNIGTDRTDSKFTDPFTAVIAPSAFIQVKVIPFTIVYQPPGNASTATYQTTNTYSTSFKMGNSTEQNNSSSTQQTSSTKGSVKLSIPLSGSSAGFGIDLGESWDNTTKQGFGTSEGTTNTSTNTLAFQTQWQIPANPDLIPGNGATCKSATDCSTLIQPTNLRAIEPYWGDTFVFQVHPQFAMWLLDAGATRYVQIAAVPVVATATVAQLAACWTGSTNWPTNSPCDLQYSQAVLQSENGAPVSYAGSQNHVTLTAEEAHRFLLLDPFFQGGQNADVRADRAINLLNTQYGAMIGQRPRPVTQSLTQTRAQAEENTGSTSTTLSVTSVRGTDATFNISESLFGALGLGGTVANGAKLTTSLDMKATFNNSTATTLTNATLAQVALNDQDITSGCNLPHCHLPLPNRPSVNVYLDKQFGGFMFQDPAAPNAINNSVLTDIAFKSRVESAVSAIKSGQLRAAQPVLSRRIRVDQTNKTIRKPPAVSRRGDR